MSKKYDKIMMQSAILWAEQSYCTRRKVGAVLAKDGRILATGYNGTISGQENCCEDIYYVCEGCGHKHESLHGKDIEIESFESSQYRGKQNNYHCKKCNHQMASIIHRANGNLHVIKDINPTVKTNEFTLHAEQNIITYCSKEGIATNGTTLYITTSPCKTCAKLIAQSGISRVVYNEDYRDTDGIDFLERVGVEVKQINL